MKMKLNDVLVLNNVVKTLIDHKTLKIDAIFKFKLLGIAKELAPFVENYQLIRTDKIKEYGTEILDAEGNPTGDIEVKEGTEAREKFDSDMEDFVNTEVELNIQKLKAQEIFDAGVPSDYLVHLFNIIEA